MSFRFQADADLNPEIGRGLRRREPSVDFRAAVGVIADGTPDPEVLQIAAGDGRVLVSRPWDLSALAFSATFMIALGTARPIRSANFAINHPSLQSAHKDTRALGLLAGGGRASEAPEQRSKEGTQKGAVRRKRRKKVRTALSDETACH